MGSQHLPNQFVPLMSPGVGERKVFTMGVYVCKLPNSDKAQPTLSPVRRAETRVDIQALRGFAVAFVVMFHAWPGIFRAGYLGVDVFFVISGYLITRLVKDAILRDTFEFHDFYSRRFRRLLPVAYTTFFVTALISVSILTCRELRDFCNQMVGAVTFSANIVLWRQTGYFDRVAELKPLLHVWSLAIEEQYYLLMPAALVITPRRFWIRGSVLACSVSLALWLYIGHFHPSPAFYLLPTRAWELAIGSVGALVTVRSRSKHFLSVSFWPSVVVLVALPFVPISGAFRLFDALLACLVTVIVILRNEPRIASTAPVKAVAWVGDLSYSLYLAHWPLAVFLRIIWSAEPPAYLGVFYVAASVLLGYALYRIVERPMRKAKFQLNWRSASAATVASVLLISIPAFALHVESKRRNYEQELRPNVGLSNTCDYRDAFTANRECSTAANPEILVWGDSIAMHLVPGIADSIGNKGVLQATRNSCGPLIDLAPLRDDGSRYNRAWAESCTSFNRSVLDYLAKPNSIKIVVLSSAFRQYVVSDGGQLLRDGAVVTEVGVERTLTAMKNTVTAIRAVGKLVVVVSPPPSSGINVSACLERRARSIPVWGPSDCNIALEDHLRYNRAVLQLLESMPREAGVKVIRLDNYLCRGGNCVTSSDRDILYVDDLHLTYSGSLFLAKQLDLLNLIYVNAN